MESTGDERCPGGFSSPAGSAAEGAPSFLDPLGTDPEQVRDVALWRKAERSRLRAERQALTVAERAAVADALIQHLRVFLDERFGGAQGLVVSAYWPIKGEPNLRPLMTELHRAGVAIALPVVETKRAPLIFRLWTPEIRMVRGDWDIPVPPPGAPIVRPDISVAPLVGWDAAGYRLGYGGGYFDRTFAGLVPCPFTIGIGIQTARLSTIFPQRHDIALDAIMTEVGLQVVRSVK